MEVTGVPISLFEKEKPMKPFWKKPGKKKMKKHSAPVQSKQASLTQRPKPEPWKPPMSAPQKKAHYSQRAKDSSADSYYQSTPKG